MSARTHGNPVFDRLVGKTAKHMFEADEARRVALNPRADRRHWEQLSRFHEQTPWLLRARDALDYAAPVLWDNCYRMGVQDATGEPQAKSGRTEKPLIEKEAMA